MDRISHLSFAAVAVLAVVFAVAGLARAGDTVDAPQQQQQRQQQVISPVEAFTLMAGEAEKGNAGAMLTLGTMYERGIGTPRSFVKALEWYRKAAAANLPEGYYNVGVCYEIGMGTTGNPTEAFNNFEKAAEQGLPQGLYKLASLYFTGNGTAKNEPWGVELLGRAAAAGHAGAANDLGVIAFEGNYGQPKDLNKAFDWFTRSAEMGNGEAMKNLAVFYRDGLGRPADPAQELKWYALARLAGYPAQPLNAAMEKVKGLMSEDQVKKVEADAQAWVQAFQKRQQAQQQAAQPKK